MIEKGDNRDALVDPRAPDEVKKIKKWMIEKEFEEL